MWTRIGVLGWLAACSGRDDEEDADAVADQASADLADLATQVEVAASAAGLSTARAATAGCTAAPYGSCEYCVGVDGGPLSGTFDLALSEAPCGGSVTRGDRSATYTVEATALAGTYDGTLAGDYVFAATGSRAASLDLGSARGDALALDASFSVDALTATTEAYALATGSVSATYEGFLDHVWTLTAEGDQQSISGTLTADDGTSCSVSGTWEAPEVGCAR